MGIYLPPQALSDVNGNANALACSYVLVTAASTWLFSHFLGMRIGPFRKAAGIPYPNMYASQESIDAQKDPQKKRALYLYNCAQRGHQNFLENYTVGLSGLLLSGLTYPIPASIAGVVWIVSRAGYALGYTSTSEKNVNGRGRFSGGLGSLYYFVHIAYLYMTIKTGVDLLKA
jgi:glutathione S-transferase